MSFRDHLSSLITSTPRNSQPDDYWSKLLEQADKLPLAEKSIDNIPEFKPRSVPPGILDLYRSRAPKSASHDDSQINDLVSRFLSNPDRTHLAHPLSHILLSQAPDDVVSGEVLELIGYDDIPLAMDIMAHRHEVAHKLLHPLPGASGSTPALHGKSKGKRRGADVEDTGKVYMTPEEAKRNMEESLRAAMSRPLFTGTAEPEAEALPNVYTSATYSGNILSSMGSKFMLPLGTTRKENEDWEEVTIPPARTVPPRSTERPISITELDPLARGSFPGYSVLNRIQSIVYPTAYSSNENLLICAPTGAGKTDVAMLTILRVLDQHSVKGPQASSSSLAANIRRQNFKIIYVAPMKALASEIVRKLGKRLAWLSIVVKELTGDMQLTKAEIAETQIIVTTPEKWDVVTRKPTGEGELASKVKLLIIDEVHLLNEDRGAVIETIVARTLRQVESTQSIIRVVGLSATLPNYLDVASFLRVSPKHGLFFFDPSFRPIPLEQHFIGVKGKAGSVASRKNLDKAAFEKVLELVAEEHQVMVFVHARKETVKTAQALREAVLAEGRYDDFDPSGHRMFNEYRREIGNSRNKEMKILFDAGFGIHHAGMLRSDRNMMERMFEARVIKVLCCTATLAWGVNLPAHAVIIKGTQVYDSTRGAFVDLSVLDVLQIFGRAGRPGMETSGVGYICTTDDKLDHYLDAITAQHPIESKFVGGMADSLNAEIALGTVANVNDGVQWVGYTYLFVRMRRNPFAYGISQDDIRDSPDLVNRREHLITLEARKLASAEMIRFDETNGSLAISDLGRIAAKYYIRHSSIEIFNKEFRKIMTEADVLAMLSMSTEFNQIQVRESELDELKVLMEEIIPCEVKGGTDTSQGKVNILLQGYISNAYVEDFALVSDTAYVAQNGGRIVRALLEIALSRKWANVSAVLMAMSKAVEKRMWPFENPLKQFKLSQDVLYNLQRFADELSPSEIAQKTAAELGQLIHLNERHGAALLAAAQQFPSAVLTYSLRPLSADLLRICVRVTRAFEWSAKIHGSSEPFWIWVEDHDGTDILQWTHILLRSTTSFLDVEFVIPIWGKPPPSVTIRLLSDRWLGAEDEVSMPLRDLAMPAPSSAHTPRLDIPFLSLSVLQDTNLESSYRSRESIRVLNDIQTQSFWTFYHASQNVLLSAPSSCGKSISGHFAIWRAILKHPTKSSLVIVPLASDARGYASRLRTLGRGLDMSVNVYTSPLKTTRLKPQPRNVIVMTPPCLLSWLDEGIDRSYLESLDTVVCENLELLDATYELAVSLLLHATQMLPVRFIGLTVSVNDPADLAQWLHVSHENLYHFRSSDRDQVLTNQSHSFTIPHSPALLKAMIKPAHRVLSASLSSPEESAIVFVPSRSQCRKVASDLIMECALEMDSHRFLGGGRGAEHAISEEDMEMRLKKLHDRSLEDTLMHGIGVLHDGLLHADRLLTVELFVDGVVRVLVVPRELCWTLPVRAGLVIVMGTQYMQIAPGQEREMSRKDGDKEPERQLKNYTIHELVRMQGLAVRSGKSGHFHLLCQAEERDAIMRFLEQGLPLESRLAEPDHLDVLRTWIARRRGSTSGSTSSSIRGKQDAMDALGFTFLSQRMGHNPVYYDAELGERDAKLSRLVDDLFSETEPSPGPPETAGAPSHPISIAS